MFPRILFFPLVLFVGAPRSFAWGKPGHHAIGALAKARVHLAALLNVIDWEVP